MRVYGRGVDVGGTLHCFEKENLLFKYVGMHWDEVWMTVVGAADAFPCAAIFCVWIFVRECVYEVVGAPSLYPEEVN
jgi:hypothetical protein